ncbi:MAG: insulinase family protein [Alistipes sp.]|nr:insulinase family protein [Alistipes sp.]
MRRNFFIICLLALVAVATGCATDKGYESVKGDPMDVRIYTLDNGLKVYMSVFDDTPRIQTFIAVRAGAKNDPAETTGLAHYFEHLMFKGSEQVGTSDYAAEKPLLDEIERLFEVYRTTEDEAERKAIYAEIDRISNEASKLSIPNEYDKLMSAIGAEGTNAWTAMDETVYVEDIPANQIENWAKVQSDRFKHNVIRGFHTELETVYEEYNMSLTRDGNKVYYGMLELLYPNHPSGQHTVLGKQEHLKNPSITNIKNFYNTYYVPNNMAICLSGDFDPEEMLAIIEKYFGDMEPNDSLPTFEYSGEEPLTEPRKLDVLGQEAEYVQLAWRAGGLNSDDADILAILSDVLSNGKCGLIDVDINQKQLLLGARGSAYAGVDYGQVVMMGMPKEGQTLDEVRDMLLAEVDKLRRGEWDEELIEATIANYKRWQMSSLESNRQRANMMVDAFIAQQPWERVVGEIERLEKITKEDVVAWANEHLLDSNYAIVYKRQGEDTTQKKIEKPQITPIATNRDARSQFLEEVQMSTVEPIEPEFIDFEEDMTVKQMREGMELLYAENDVNELFTLSYVLNFGCDYDPAMKIACDYVSLLGSGDMSLAEFQYELYKLASSIHVSSSNIQTAVVISGLQENMEATVALVERFMHNLKADEEVLATYKQNLIKSRQNNLFNQQSNFAALTQYALYGGEFIDHITLSNEEVMALTSEELLERIDNLFSYEHDVRYYGPADIATVEAIVNKHHIAGDTLKSVADMQVIRTILPTPENRVLIAPYDAKQVYYRQISNRGETFSTDNDAIIELYNSYFSGGMNSIVFQEMREARGLAYSSSAGLYEGGRKELPYYFTTFIATQNDKLQQAIEAFAEIVNNMPVSQNAFDLAKDAIIKSLESQRANGREVINTYASNELMGVDCDRREGVYNAIKSLTLDDVIAFQQAWIKDRNYTYIILGDPNDIDINYLSTLGKVEIIPTEDIFCY